MRKIAGGTTCFNSPTNGSQVNARSVWTINPDQTVTIRTTLAKTFVDNTYGTNTVGWNRDHSFGNLTGSDQLQIALKDASGVTKMEFKMDYISSSSAAPSGYKSLGVTGGDGKMVLGNASDVVKVVTSLDKNFNDYGYVLTTNSPATDANYSPNPSYPNWIYEVWYEATVKLSAFGSAGFGMPNITGVHASPSKTGNNSEEVVPGPCPEFGASAVGKDVACFTTCTGAVDLTINNGKAPYQVSWSNGATTEDIDNLCPGTYTATVTDATGAQVTATATVNDHVQNCSGSQCFESPTKSDVVNAQSVWTINADGTVTIRTTLAKTFVDNTYGTNTIGWPKDHKFDDLKGSDQLQIALYDKAGTKKMEFKMDYISDDKNVPSKYRSLGVTGGDGKMIVGSSSDVVKVITSLDKNFNDYGYVLTTNSPATNASYTPNPSYPNWIYEVWYEVTVKLSAFGTSGFGKSGITGVHASPSKTGQNSEPVTEIECCNLAVSGTTKDVTCHGSKDGSIDITVTGATGSVSYLWNDGATTEDRSNLSAGKYSVVVKSGTKCVGNAEFTINEPAAINITYVSTPVTCFGGSDGTIDITVTGGTPPYIYQWSDAGKTEDRTGLTASIYGVTVYDARGCNSTIIIHVHTPIKLRGTVQVQGTTSRTACDGAASITGSGGVGPYNYYWQDGYKGKDRNGLCKGVYYACVIDSKGCRDTVKIVIPVGAAPASGSRTQSSFTATASPNPTMGITKLSINSDVTAPARINIIDVNTGKLMMKLNMNLVKGLNNKEINLSLLPRSVYQLEIISGNSVESLKVIKQ